jgi:hypothetical protein
MKYLGSARPTVTLAVIMFFGLLTGTPFLAAAASETNSTSLFIPLTTLNPEFGTNLDKLAAMADLAAKAEKKESKAEKKMAASGDLKNLPVTELRQRFTDETAKHESRGFSAIGRLAQEALQANDPDVRAAHVEDILEIQAALRNARRPLVPEKLGVVTTWIFFFENMSGKIGVGETMATNLARAIDSGSDQGRNDPKPSTFWTRPPAIAQEDLYASFGRNQLPHIEDTLCEYNAPKITSGTHAGFDVICNGKRLKIKFGDLSSEPFTARIFYALGYHADPTDYTPSVKIRYDRRMLREFHMRKPLTMRITPFGIHVGTVQIQTHYDPFSFITSAVFKDGREVSGSKLKEMLFLNPSLAHPEDSPENFRPEVEASLDYLVMAAANVQPRDGPTQSIASWEFGGLGHEHRRELRGAGLLAAWLSWFDSRADNTKLRVERDTEEVKLEHFISDLGGGMGGGKGFFSPRGENPNEFTWSFTAPEIFRGPGRMTSPFRIEHFKPTVPTPAFAAMTADDARWMARLVGQLTENQLRAALIAAGYDNAESRLYLEKLISRRDQMVRDLNLENEIPLLRPNGQDRAFSYAPSTDGPFETVFNGSKVSARTTSAVVSGGRLIH